jgi:hypothetical protein
MRLINYCVGLWCNNVHCIDIFGKHKLIQHKFTLQYIYHSDQPNNNTGEQMPTKKELEKRREKRKHEEEEKNPKTKADEPKKDTEIVKKQTEANKTKKHK